MNTTQRFSPKRKTLNIRGNTYIVEYCYDSEDNIELLYINQQAPSFYSVQELANILEEVL